MPEMSSGDAIRRLDAISKEVHERWTAEPPFLAAERHALARSLTRLLPVIAAMFPDHQDKKSSSGLGEHAQRWFTEARPLQRPLEANRTEDESDWT
jgi:hypothetical protein